MPPVNTSNTPQPQPPKEGFFSKLSGLFKKKAAVAADPPHTSLTPEPRLDNGPAEVSEGSPNVQSDPTVPLQPSAGDESSTLQVPSEVNTESPTPPVANEPVQSVSPVTPTPAPAPQPVMQPGPQPSPFDTPVAPAPTQQPVSPAPGVPQMPPMPDRPPQPAQPGQPPVPPTPQQ